MYLKQLSLQDKENPYMHLGDACVLFINPGPIPTSGSFLVASVKRKSKPSQSTPAEGSKLANPAESDCLSASEQLTDIFMRMQFSLRSELLQNLATYQLSDHHYWILIFLRESGGLSLGEVAKLSSQSTGATTATMDKMEEMGVAERYLVPDDRRKVHARITKKGLDVLENLFSIETERVLKIMAKLDAAELRSWISGSLKIRPDVSET